jgi:CMP-N-acetylneuraminic acid synthetase
MIIALLVGRGGSVGMPNKNVYPVLKRPLMSYPLMAALNSKFINEVYVSTDSKEIKNVAIQYGAKVINRPPELATSEAILENTLEHGYKHVKAETKKEIELVVVLMCNAVMILPETIDQGIEILKKRKEIDSAVTVSDYNMWSPIKARKVGEDGLLHPFIPFEKFKFKVDSNRQKQDTVYFHDCGASIVRSKCIENIKDGLLPQKWMGNKIYPLKQKGGLDIDYSYEIPLAEHWLKEKGFAEQKIPYKKNK